MSDRRIQPGDCADDNPTMIAGHVRALQREVRDGFEQFGRAILPALERLEGKVDVLIDRQNVAERRIDDLETRVADLEKKATRRRRAPGRK